LSGPIDDSHIEQAGGVRTIDAALIDLDSRDSRSMQAASRPVELLSRSLRDVSRSMQPASTLIQMFFRSLRVVLRSMKPASTKVRCLVRSTLPVRVNDDQIDQSDDGLTADQEATMAHFAHVPDSSDRYFEKGTMTP